MVSPARRRKRSQKRVNNIIFLVVPTSSSMVSASTNIHHLIVISQGFWHHKFTLVLSEVCKIDPSTSNYFLLWWAGDHPNSSFCSLFVSICVPNWCANKKKKCVFVVTTLYNSGRMYFMLYLVCGSLLEIIYVFKEEWKHFFQIYYYCVMITNKHYEEWSKHLRENNRLLQKQCLVDAMTTFSCKLVGF